MRDNRLSFYGLYALLILLGVVIAIWPGIGQRLSYPGWRPTRRGMRVWMIIWLAGVVTLFIYFVVQDLARGASRP